MAGGHGAPLRPRHSSSLRRCRADREHMCRRVCVRVALSKYRNHSVYLKKSLIVLGRDDLLICEKVSWTAPTSATLLIGVIFLFVLHLIVLSFKCTVQSSCTMPVNVCLVKYKRLKWLKLQRTKRFKNRENLYQSACLALCLHLPEKKTLLKTRSENLHFPLSNIL